MTQRTQQLFDSIAPRYDVVNAVLSLRRDRQWRRAGVKKLAGPAYQSVLDLCAGTLALTQELLRVNPTCRVTAYDFSEKMLKTGWKRLPDRHRLRVTRRTGDAHKLPFAAAQFDAVMCAYGMRNLEDNERALAEIHRVLRPGGRLVVLEFLQPDRLLPRLFQATYGRFVIPWLGGVLTRDKAAYDHLRDSVRRFYTPAAYAALLEAAGFRDIGLKRQTGGISCQITADR